MFVHIRFQPAPGAAVEDVHLSVENLRPGETVASFQERLLTAAARVIEVRLAPEDRLAWRVTAKAWLGAVTRQDVIAGTLRPIEFVGQRPFPKPGREGGFSVGAEAAEELRERSARRTSTPGGEPAPGSRRKPAPGGI